MAAVEDKLEVIHVAVDDLVKNQWNPNRQSERVKQAERESIETFGFIDPIFVRPLGDGRRYEIVDGEHRWLTVKELGHETVPVIVRDLTDAQAKKLTIVLNETRGDADSLLLGTLLTDLSEEDDFRTALPYTDREIEKLLALAADTDDVVPEEPPPANDPVEKELTLSYDLDRFDNVQGWLTILGKEYGIRGKKNAADVVYEALRRSALEANQARVSRS